MVVTKQPGAALDRSKPICQGSRTVMVDSWWGIGQSGWGRGGGGGAVMVDSWWGRAVRVG